MAKPCYSPLVAITIQCGHNLVTLVKSDYAVCYWFPFINNQGLLFVKLYDNVTLNLLILGGKTHTWWRNFSRIDDKIKISTSIIIFVVIIITIRILIDIPLQRPPARELPGTPERDKDTWERLHISDPAQFADKNFRNNQLLTLEHILDLAQFADKNFPND